MREGMRRKGERRWGEGKKRGEGEGRPTISSVRSMMDLSAPQLNSCRPFLPTAAEHRTLLVDEGDTGECLSLSLTCESDGCNGGGVVVHCLHVPVSVPHREHVDQPIATSTGHKLQPF